MSSGGINQIGTSPGFNEQRRLAWLWRRRCGYTLACSGMSFCRQSKLFLSPLRNRHSVYRETITTAYLLVKRERSFHYQRCAKFSARSLLSSFMEFGASHSKIKSTVVTAHYIYLVSF
jgi:hypothetical protein